MVRIPADAYGGLLGCADACQWIDVMVKGREEISTQEIKEILQKFCPNGYKRCRDIGEIMTEEEERWIYTLGL